MAARTLMIQGTASHVGKTVLTAALCRIFVRKGLRVAPFKAQNMSNNSFVTPDGKEIGRAQAVQAAACRLAPRTDFNPVLIKPVDERSAQLVINGKVTGLLTASDFGRIRREYFPIVQEAFSRLASEFDLVILEGAGSPAEVNLRDQDIVNMRMAQVAGAPVVLVGDIDRGGVFASLVGTLALLQPEEQGYVKGFLINKLRGDAALLTSGVRMVEARTGVKCLGVLPYWGNLQVPEEDSLGWESWAGIRPSRPDALTIGVADVPSISNFTDFEAFVREPDVRLVRLTDATVQPLDALIFPGTKNTAQALKFVRTRGLDQVARRVLAGGGTVIGSCGAYQLMGRRILDPHGVESSEPELEGLGLLDVVTSFAREKVTVGVTGFHRDSGCSIEGYEVHMGDTCVGDGVEPLLMVRTAGDSNFRTEGAVSLDGRILGTYVHGLFDSSAFRRRLLNRMRVAQGWAPLDSNPAPSCDQQLDDLADFVAQHVDLKSIDAIIEQGIPKSGS